MEDSSIKQDVIEKYEKEAKEKNTEEWFSQGGSVRVPESKTSHYFIDRKVKQALELLNTEKQREAKVLEIGCSFGHMTSLLANQFTHLTALDISPTSVEIASKRLAKYNITNVSFLVDDAEILETIPDNSIDIVFHSNSFFNTIVNIAVANVSTHMARLRNIRNLIILNYDNNYWIVNTNSSPIQQLQFALSTSTNILERNHIIRQIGNHLIIEKIHGMAYIHFRCKAEIRFKKCTVYKLPISKKLTIKLGSKIINIIAHHYDSLPSDKNLSNIELEVKKKNDPSLSGWTLTNREEYRLILGQMWIIAREILLKGRSFNSNAYLDANKPILLENHDNW